MWNINAPQGHIPCAIFTKFAEFVPRFRMRYLLKFCWISSSCYGVMGVLSCQGLVIPKFSAPTMFSERSRCHPNQFPIGRVISECMNTVRVHPSGETMYQTRKSFRGARMSSGSSISISPCQVWCGLDFTRYQGGQKRWVFLSVCLSVRHAFECQSLCARFRREGIGVQKWFWYHYIG